MNHEEAIVVTADGKVWHCVGNKIEVAYDGVSSPLIGAYSYHNHPQKATFGSFGQQDVGSFIENQEQFSMASDHKYIYTMTRTEKTKWNDADSVIHEHNLEYHASLGKVREKGGDPDMDVYHETLKTLSKRYGFNYERKKIK